MIDSSNIHMDEVVIHRVGNKSRQEDVVVSNDRIRIHNEEAQQLLFQYLLSPFAKVKTINHFVHPTNLKFNEVYSFVRDIFVDKSAFLSQSQNIARHLYEKSIHPRIKGGEFYMAYLTNVSYGEVVVDAIGMFRTENKETYLKVMEQSESFEIEYDQGINVNALDKGCLVLNLDAEDGYKVLVVDAHGKGANEARYWKDEFLQVEVAKTPEALVKTYAKVLDEFVTTQFGEDEDRIKPALFRTRAIQYFEEKDTFDRSEFENEVISEPEKIVSFRNFQMNHADLGEQGPPETFEIPRSSVKVVKSKMKSVIKLDTDVDIYLRNESVENLQFIEQGDDEQKNMKYYKIYYNSERS